MKNKKEQRISTRILEVEFETFGIPLKRDKFYSQTEVDSFVSVTASEVGDLEDDYKKLLHHYTILKDKDRNRSHNNDSNVVENTSAETETTIVSRSNNQVSERMLSHIQALLQDAEQRSSKIAKEAEIEKGVIISDAKKEADRIIYEAQKKAKEIVYEATDQSEKLKSQAEEKINEVKFYQKELEEKSVEVQTALLIKAKELDTMKDNISKLSQEIKSTFGNQQSA
ncbi:hypothetical protein AAGG74_18215 [Bacillus mexicanus]|uniref:hypothetical protein n=1 Tax=Bacillus mexicanus TaxID=2834415 RepID=UPI003D245A97